MGILGIGLLLALIIYVTGVRMVWMDLSGTGGYLGDRKLSLAERWLRSFFWPVLLASYWLALFRAWLDDKKK